MKLYHGTTSEFVMPDLSKGRENTDFGIGFYLTDKESMAKNWKKGHPNNHVNVYELTLANIETCNLIIKRFENADIEWAKFVYNNRKGKNKKSRYDLIIGPLADNGLENWFTRLENGEIDWDDLAKGIEFNKFQSLQFCFVKPNAIKLLEYAERK